MGSRTSLGKIPKSPKILSKRNVQNKFDKLKAALGLPPLETKSTAKDDALERPKLASYSSEIQDEIQNSDDSNNAPKTSAEVQKKLSRDIGQYQVKSMASSKKRVRKVRCKVCEA